MLVFIDYGFKSPNNQQDWKPEGDLQHCEEGLSQAIIPCEYICIVVIHNRKDHDVFIHITIQGMA